MKIKTKTNILLPREAVNNSLRLGRSLSYELFPAIRFANRIKIQSVLSLLKLSAINGATLEEKLPNDLMTLAEAANECGISTKWFMVHVRRGEIPCFRLSKKHVLIPKSQFTNTLIHKKGNKRNG